MPTHSFNARTAVTAIDNAWIGQTAEVMICIAAALLVLRLELQRRSGERGSSATFTSGMASCKQLLRQCSPEIAGIIACLSLAALLRARGDNQNNDDPAWISIKQEWPLLLGADTLLSLQTMLRLVVFSSGALRIGFAPLPLADEAAFLSFGAYVMRALLLARTNVYMLDGPLGGNLPAGFEVAAIPLLIAIGGLRALRNSPLIAATVFACVGWLCSRHYLAFTDDTIADKLFIAAHVFDFLAACAYLARSLYVGNRGYGNSATIGLTHVLMVVQSSLSAYYFLRAFDESPSLVAAGHPFQLLQVSNVVQCGAYLVAAALFIAECFEEFTAPDSMTSAFSRGEVNQTSSRVVQSSTCSCNTSDKNLSKAQPMVL